MKERIKKIRKTLDLTQQEFAERIGVKRNTVATYEMGRSIPSDAAVSLICREFNVNETWLRTGEGEMFKVSPVSELDALVEKYGLGDAARVLIERFITLKAEEREVIINFIQSAAVAMNKAQSTAPPLQKLTIDERIEIIRHQMELEEKAKAELSVLNGNDISVREESKIG